MVFFASSPYVQSFFAWPPLSVLFQAELAMNIHVNVSDMRGDVSRIREEISGQVQSVSALKLHSTCRESEDAYNFLGPNQVGNFDVKESSILHFHLASLESHLPRGREPALDATT
jgi:hypothetical protein